MKSKPLTYFLIVVVLAVWGIIAKKILTDNSTSTVVVAKPASAVAADTVDESLWLNYRDPFGIPTAKEPSATSFVEPLPVTAATPLRENISFVCIGQVATQSVQYCIIEDNGQQHIICKGESIEGFRLASIDADSLVFIKNGQSYCIARHDGL